MKGLRQVTENDVLAKLLRRLPARELTPGAVWTTPDLSWLVQVHEGPESDSPQVEAYHRFPAPGASRADPLPTAWHPLGVGWEALQAFLTRAETVAKDPPGPKGGGAGGATDPRSIRF